MAEPKICALDLDGTLVDSQHHSVAAMTEAFTSEGENPPTPDAVRQIVGLPLDVALRRNDQDWLERLPPEIEDQLVHKLYYGHFMCHVMHQDYIVKKGADPKALKAAMLTLFEYPAEHNVGHLYKAKPDLAAHYKSCDPTNSFNPGIGKMSKARTYR
jgi:FAD/FMN-containing dehydrogenase